MLTNRLWMSVIARMRFGRPYTIWKEEYVIDFSTKFIPSTFGGDLTRKRTVPGIVEVRAITFSDVEQVPVGVALVERVARYVASFVYADLATAYMFARLDPDEIEVETASEEREVTYTMLRNHVSAMARVLARIVGERPPIIRPWLGFIISYEMKEMPRILQVCFVVPDRLGNPPSNVYLYCREYGEVVDMIAWEWRPGQPDDIVPIHDNYVTIDYDDYDDPSIELDVIKVEGLRKLGIVDNYEVKSTGRGKHLLVWFKRKVPVYYIKRYILHDDEFRERADELRFLVTGVHDTLFNRKNGRLNEF